MKNWVRWFLAPLVRWLSKGGVWGWIAGRSEEAVFVIVEDVYGDEYSIELSPDKARKIGRELMRMARDVQEGVPLEPECQGET